MPKAFRPLALTANDLMTGEVIWWTGANWSRRPADALIAEGEEAAAPLHRLAEDPAVHAAVVGPYLVEFEVAADQLRPVSRRERIRQSGAPTFDFKAAPQPQPKAA